MTLEKKQDGMKLMISIVERGQGKMLTKVYEKYHLSCHFLSVGRETASSELLDVLGFGSTERTVILSLGADRVVDRLMYELEEGVEAIAHCKGIAFDLSLTGLNHIMAVLLQNQIPEEIGGEVLEKRGKNSLILIVANQGHTDEIMNTARAAGARGGTILRSRWAGPEDTEQFYGIKIQAEKEIVVIVASAETRNAIMETVNRKHGLKTEAGAMICSVGIDQMVRLG